jgi:peptidoglycan/xylan/chitin deacetylase (PgdA/CDA1 family)
VCEGATIPCPQLPTTLPTLDELIGVDGITADNVADRVLGLSREAPPAGHVFTLHAELEGMKLAGVFERLLTGWKALGYELVPLRAIAESIRAAELPRCHVVAGEIPGRSGEVALQAGPISTA